MNAPVLSQSGQGFTTQAEDVWTVAGRSFRSRLIVGTGKYKDYATNAAAAEAAGAEIVTVALRRVNLSDPSQPMLADFVKPDRFTYLPNTAGCFTGEDAVRTLRLAREAGGWSGLPTAIRRSSSWVPRRGGVRPPRHEPPVGPASIPV